MVSTAFTFPMNEPDSQAPGYPKSILQMFTNILQDKNVDILAPQFYESYGGFVPTANFYWSNQHGTGFSWWKENVPDTTHIMPILRSQASDVDADFKRQVKIIEGLCTGNNSYTNTDTCAQTCPASDYKDFDIFCRDQKYFLWVSN